MPGIVYLTGAVRGLISEGERAVTLIERTKPEAVCLSVSKEGLEALMRPEGNTDGHRAVNVEEEIYMRGLAQFGRVVRPPPCFSMAVSGAAKSGLDLKPLDMDDEHYTAAYCRYVSTMDMLRQGRSGKMFLRYRFKSATPERFVMEWDALVNRLAGYRRLERAREHWFAKRISRISEDYGRVLVIVEMERLQGVEKQLTALGCRFERVH